MARLGTPHSRPLSELSPPSSISKQGNDPQIFSQASLVETKEKGVYFPFPKCVKVTARISHHSNQAGKRHQGYPWQGCNYVTSWKSQSYRDSEKVSDF